MAHCHPFFIFGPIVLVEPHYKERIFRKAPWRKNPCPRCKKESLVFTVVGSYIHFLSIPDRPWKKDVELSCSSCGHIVKDDRLLKEAEPIVYGLKKQVKFPWYWHGRIITFAVLLLFTLVIVPISQGFATNDYLEKPAKNDIYVIQDSTTPGKTTYNFWKVYATGDIEMMFLKNAVDYDYIPEELDPDDGFFKSVFYVKRAELKQLQKDGLIKRIIRGYPRQSTFNRYLEVEKAD